MICSSKVSLIKNDIILTILVLCPKARVQKVRTERPGMNRSYHELVQRLEVGKATLGPLGRKVDVCSEVDIGCDREYSRDVIVVDEGEEVLEFKFSALDGGIFLSVRVPVVFPSGDNACEDVSSNMTQFQLHFERQSKVSFLFLIMLTYEMELTKWIMGTYDFPCGSGGHETVFEPSKLLLAHHVRQGFTVVIDVGAAVGTEVKEEDFEVLAKPLRPVDGGVGVFFDGVEFIQRLDGSLVESIRGCAFFVQRSTESLPEPPVVGYFMIVPLNKDGCLGEKALHLLVSVVVLPIGPALSCELMCRIYSSVRSDKVSWNLHDRKNSYISLT